MKRPRTENEAGRLESNSPPDSSKLRPARERDSSRYELEPIWSDFASEACCSFEQPQQRYSRRPEGEKQREDASASTSNDDNEGGKEGRTPSLVNPGEARTMAFKVVKGRWRRTAS